MRGEREMGLFSQACLGPLGLTLVFLWSKQSKPGHSRRLQPEEEFSFLLNALMVPGINLFGVRDRNLRQSATSVVCVSWLLLIREKVAEGC